MNAKMNLLPWGRIRSAFKLSDVNLLDPSKKTTLKNRIENANAFYKQLVGMDKVEKQRSNMINLKGLLIKAKESLDLENYKLKVARYQMKRLDGEISKMDRVRHYERFAELLQKEKSLKYKEEELMEKVKLKETERETILTKLDATKATVLMLEKDHSFYQRWIKYLFSGLAVFSTGCYVTDNKKILEGIAEIKKMNRSGGGDGIFQFLVSTAYGGIATAANGLWWGCEKGYGGLKCGARMTWNAGKWAGSGVKAGAEKTVDAAKWGCGYASWAAYGGYNQVKKLIYPGKKD